MKPSIYLFILLFFSSSNFVEKEVYICGTKGSSRYHYTKECRGMNNCKHEINKVKLSEAKNFGLTLCKWED
jgi:hypothetical protein